MQELQALVRAVVDANHYMTLGTVEPTGQPRLSPVYFTQADYRRFWWVSSPEAQHSRNIAGTADVAIVIYDSSRPVGKVDCVYLNALAAEVLPANLAAECAAAFASPRLGPTGAAPFTPDELSGPADLRLYRAVVTSHEVHIRGSHPVWGTGIDRRMVVVMP